MNLADLRFWFQGFLEVICPNYFTLAMIIIVLIVFGIGKLFYSRKQVADNAAMQQIGKRWQSVGYFMIAAIICVYIAEYFIVKSTQDLIVKNIKEPQQKELQTLLRITAEDLEDIDAIKDPKKRKKAFDGYKVKRTLSLAEVNDLELSRDFSQVLAQSHLKRFYDKPTSSDSKRKAVERIQQQLGYDSADKAKLDLLKKAALAEFYYPEYKDAFEDLQTIIKKGFEKKTFSGIIITSKMQGREGCACTYKELKDGSFNDPYGVIKRASYSTDQEILEAAFREKVPGSSITYNELFPDLKDQILKEFEACAIEVANTDNLTKINNSICNKIDSEPTYKGYSEEKKLVEFYNLLNQELLTDWKNRINWENCFRNKESYLYRNDKYDFKKSSPEMKDLNKQFVNLKKLSNWFTNLFWGIILMVIILVLFILRGKQIRDLGSVQKIKSKIKG